MFSEKTEKAFMTFVAFVLILVLVEYVLRDAAAYTLTILPRCLNPCFSGICSQRLGCLAAIPSILLVLILVLVEYVLRGIKSQFITLNIRES